MITRVCCRLLVVLLAIGFGVNGSALAQEEVTPEPPTPALSGAELQALATQVAEAVENAERTLEEAEQAYELANSSFSYFEGLSAVFGIALPFLAVLAGFFGFSRLQSAQSELRAAREQFEDEMRERSNELDVLREQLQQTAIEQRDRAGKASLALALLPLGEQQYRAQDYTGALDTYHRALELDPDNPIIHYRLGYVYSQSDQFAKAREHLQRSLQLDPNLAPSLATLGYVYRRLAEHEPDGIERDMLYNQAEENFLKALRQSPKLMDEDKESWWGSLGGLYRRRGQIQQAIRAYEQCAEITPQSSYPFSNLALLYAQTQNRERMLEVYTRVEQLAYAEVQAEVDNYWAYADLIAARLALGKLDEHDPLIDAALRTSPEDSPYTLTSLIDTLKRLMTVLEPHEHPPIQRVIDKIEVFKQERHAEA